jgi:hypothetical protein
MPRPLFPRGKSPLYPLDRRLGGPQSRSGRHGEVKILAPTGTRPAHSQSLYRLSYRGSDFKWLLDIFVVFEGTCRITILLNLPYVPTECPYHELCPFLHISSCDNNFGVKLAQLKALARIIMKLLFVAVLTMDDNNSNKY